MKGYVPLRRGIFEHLPVFSFAETKVYVALLCLADFRTGKAIISISDLADAIGCSYKTAQLAVGRLAAMKYISVSKAQNQWRDTIFTIKKYKTGYVKFTEPGTTPTTEATTTPGTTAQDSNQGKGASKNLKNSKNLKKSTSTLSGKPDDIQKIFDLWVAQKVVTHKNLTPDMKKAANKALKTFSLTEILEAIKNYGEVFASPNHYFSYRWTLEEFLIGGGKDRIPFGNLKRFLSEAKPLENFKEDTNGQSRRGSSQGHGIPAESGKYDHLG